MILYGLPPLYQSPPVDEYGQPVPVPGPVPMAPTMAANGPMSPAGGIPAPMTPSMALPPPPGYMGRFGDALRMAPAFHGAPGMSAGQGFAGGLMAGLSGGLQANAAGSEKQAAMQAQAVNTKNKTMADFNNQLVMKTYENALAEQLRKRVKEDGMITIAPDDVTKFWLPSSMPVGSKVAPAALAPYAMAMNKPQQEALVPIPNEPALAKYMGGNPGDLVKRSDILSARTGMKPTGGGLTGSNEPMTDSAISFVGDYLIRTGTLLPFGMGNAANRGKVFDYVSHNSTASTVAGNKAGLASDAASLKTMQTGLDQVTAYKNTATANAKVLDAAMAGIPDAGNKPLNWLMRTAADKFGSTGTSGFNTALETVRPEFQRILQSGGQLSSGAVLTVEGRKDMKATLDGNATVGQIRRSLAVLETDAENRRKSYQDQIGVIQKRIGGGMSMGGGDRVRIVRNGVPGTILRTDVLPTDTVVQ